MIVEWFFIILFVNGDWLEVGKYRTEAICEQAKAKTLLVIDRAPNGNEVERVMGCFKKITRAT